MGIKSLQLTRFLPACQPLPSLVSLWQAATANCSFTNFSSAHSSKLPLLFPQSPPYLSIPLSQTPNYSPNYPASLITPSHHNMDYSFPPHSPSNNTISQPMGSPSSFNWLEQPTQQFSSPTSGQPFGHPPSDLPEARKHTQETMFVTSIPDITLTTVSLSVHTFFQ